jgi:RNA polymerase sigma-70 factor (ECF subfamily)
VLRRVWRRSQSNRLGTQEAARAVKADVDQLTKTDEALVAAARAGSAAAEGELFSRHWRPAWQRAFAITGRRAAADDVAQDAMVRALGGLARFDGRSSFATWLHRIVVNRAIDWLRTEERTVPLGDVPERSLEWEPPAGADPGLVRAVAALTPDRRAVIVMRYWLDLAPGEIADLLGVALGTVHSRLARALTDLRERMEVSDAGRP